MDSTLSGHYIILEQADFYADFSALAVSAKSTIDELMRNLRDPNFVFLFCSG